jgi:hypothetical protein
MKKDGLIQIWKEGSARLFSDKKTDKEMITQYLNERTLKGNRSIRFNILFYGLFQIASIILISMNLAAYLNNTVIIKTLISMLVLSIGILVFGMDVYRRFREINNYSESLKIVIEKQLNFYRRPYEFWLILASVSVIILIINLNLYVDNDGGTYKIYNKLRFAGITFGTFLFIYGALKATSILGLRKLKAYLSDLQVGTLDQSKQMERNQKRFLWLWIALFVVLLAMMVLGLLKALSLGPF